MKHGIRRLVGAVLTASFALSAITWGSMPGCSLAQAQGVHAGHHGMAPVQGTDPGKAPASIKCFVHLCCVHLVAPAASVPPLERLSPPEGSARLTVAGSTIPIRPSHTLPFAHAPPVLA